MVGEGKRVIMQKGREWRTKTKKKGTMRKKRALDQKYKGEKNILIFPKVKTSTPDALLVRILVSTSVQVPARTRPA